MLPKGLITIALAVSVAVSPLAAQETLPRDPNAPAVFCGAAEGVRSRICIIDGQIRDVERQLRVVRGAGGVGQVAPRVAAGEIIRLERELAQLKVRRQLLMAGRFRVAAAPPPEEDDDPAIFWLLPGLLLMLLASGGGGRSTPVKGSDTVGGEEISPS